MMMAISNSVLAINGNHCDQLPDMEEPDDLMDLPVTMAKSATPTAEKTSNMDRKPVANGRSSPLKRSADEDEVPHETPNGEIASTTELSPRRSKRARHSDSGNIKISSSPSGSPTPNGISGNEWKGVAQARRSDRKRIEKEEHVKELESCQPPYVAITAEEKRTWKGWCEIESDPAFFNVMLRDLGVEGLKVHELYTIQADEFAMLPQPVYGFIFLFHYVKEDEDDGVQQACPAHVWFANQVAHNACGSYALFNIINNIPNANLGRELTSFKDQTKDLTPVERGTAVAESDFIRQVHNTFARTIERQNLDACLEEEMEKAVKEKKKKKKGKKSKKKLLDDDAAFHFIAYVPVHGDLWEMDGLDEQPHKLGPCTPDDWVDLVAAHLSARMESGLEYNIVALVRDPILNYREQLGANIKLLQSIEARLDSVNIDWKTFAAGDDDDTHVTDASEVHEVTAAVIDEATLAASDQKKLYLDDDITTLMEWRERVIKDQAPLRAGIRDELNSRHAHEAIAADRRNDFGPLIQTWLNMLAEREKLRDISKMKK